MDDFKMTEEQRELFDKLTKLQKGIVTHVIAGMKPSEAHREAGGTCKNESNRRVLAHEILTNPNVKAFLDSVEYEAVNEAIMGRQEMIERLSSLSRTNMSDLVTWQHYEVKDIDGAVVKQSAWRIKEDDELDEMSLASIAELTAGPGGIKIKQHSPLAAMKQLADLAGYNAAKQVEVVLTDDFDSLLSDAADDEE